MIKTKYMKITRFLILFSTLCCLACSEFDDTDIWNELNDHAERIAALEKACEKINTNLTSLQSAIKAAEEKNSITNIVTIMEDGHEVGYYLFLSQGEKLVFWKDSNRQVPSIGIMRANDGIYYWTYKNDWILDNDGIKYPINGNNGVVGVTPVVKVENDYWMISFDNGNTWKQLESVEEESEMLESITQDGSNVYLTLGNGTVITIPLTGSGDAEVLYASAYGVVPGNVDSDKMSKLMSEASAKGKTIRFNDGTYIFDKTIEVSSNVSIIGNTNTIFKPSSSTTPTVLMNIAEADNVFLSHIVFDGGLNACPTTEGTQVGLSVTSCRRVNIENVEFSGWSKQGLYSKTMSSYGTEASGKFYKHFQITNCRFYFNYCGNFFDYRCEYSQVLNCVWGKNCIGTLNCGGNNAYVSCQWNANTTGFQMESSGSNPAHGGCNGCTFNHNYENAVLINDCVNGWTFEGCQIFYGKIVLNKSKGVIFNGNLWGSCEFHSNYPGKTNQNLIVNTYFLTDSASILAHNDGSTFVYCCLPDHLPDDSTGQPGSQANIIEDESLTQLLYTAPGTSSGSSNAYFANCSSPIPANQNISKFYIGINSASASSIVAGVNVWVANASTNTVVEKVVDNKDIQVMYSKALSKLVLCIDLNKTYDFPVYFIAQATRTDGVGISYSTGETSNNWLGTKAPAIGDVITPGSAYVPEFAAY